MRSIFYIILFLLSNFFLGATDYFFHDYFPEEIQKNILCQYTSKEKNIKNLRGELENLRVVSKAFDKIFLRLVIEKTDVNWHFFAPWYVHMQSYIFPERIMFNDFNEPKPNQEIFKIFTQKSLFYADIPHEKIDTIEKFSNFCAQFGIKKCKLKSLQQDGINLREHKENKIKENKIKENKIKENKIIENIVTHSYTHPFSNKKQTLVTLFLKNINIDDAKEAEQEAINSLTYLDRTIEKSHELIFRVKKAEPHGSSLSYNYMKYLFESHKFNNKNIKIFVRYLSNNGNFTFCDHSRILYSSDCLEKKDPLRESYSKFFFYLPSCVDWQINRHKIKCTTHTCHHYPNKHRILNRKFQQQSIDYIILHDYFKIHHRRMKKFKPQTIDRYFYACKDLRGRKPNRRCTCDKIDNGIQPLFDDGRVTEFFNFIFAIGHQNQLDFKFFIEYLALNRFFDKKFYDVFEDYCSSLELKHFEDHLNFKEIDNPEIFFFQVLINPLLDGEIKRILVNSKNLINILSIPERMQEQFKNISKNKNDSNKYAACIVQFLEEKIKNSEWNDGLKETSEKIIRLFIKNNINRQYDDSILKLFEITKNRSLHGITTLLIDQAKPENNYNIDLIAARYKNALINEIDKKPSMDYLLEANVPENVKKEWIKVIPWKISLQDYIEITKTDKRARFLLYKQLSFKAKFTFFLGKPLFFWFPESGQAVFFRTFIGTVIWFVFSWIVMLTSEKIIKKNPNLHFVLRRTLLSINSPWYPLMDEGFFWKYWQKDVILEETK